LVNHQQEASVKQQQLLLDNQLKHQAVLDNHRAVLVKHLELIQLHQQEHFVAVLQRVVLVKQPLLLLDNQLKQQPPLGSQPNPPTHNQHKQQHEDSVNHQQLSVEFPPQVL